MTTQQAVKTFLYQVNKTGRSPFDTIFSAYGSHLFQLQNITESGIEHITGRKKK
jgi:antitoxin component of RelBE/YafQ-DinJ toxin-antitoxin module